MADQKIDPTRPKDDPNAVGTVYQPLATPSVDEKGNVLPLGKETLEKQREGFIKAATPPSSTPENPLEVAGVDADIEEAKQNPEASAGEGATKEDVEKQGKKTKEALKQQGKTAKASPELAKTVHDTTLKLPTTTAQPAPDALDAKKKSGGVKPVDAKTQEKEAK